MSKPKKDDYTSGYDQIDRDNAPEITFATAFGANLPDGVSTPALDRGYLYTDTGLLVERDLTDSDWRGMLPEIQAIHSAYQFIVGDWAVYGVEHGYEDSYAAVAGLTGFEASTVEFYASICRNIPRLVRTNRLTFGHYQRIAPLPEGDRAYWITYAVDHESSIRDLREAIAQSKLPADTAAIAPDVESDAPPPPDEIDEEATDVDAPSLPLEDDEVWKTLDSLQQTLKTGGYRNVTDREALFLRKRIAIARQALTMLEAELPKPKRSKR